MIKNKITDRVYEKVSIKNIDISSFNARKEGINNGLDELVNSIREFGLILPVILLKKPNEKYELLVGQRRLEAYKSLKEDKIPAIIINNLSSEAKEIVSFAENIHRRDLGYNDTIRICEHLFKSYEGSKKEKISIIAKKIGISPNLVGKYLGYVLIPKEVRKLVTEKKITRNQAHQVTTAFWPNITRIISVAKLLEGKPKAQWERALDIGSSSPDMPAKEVAEKAKKPIIQTEITLKLDKKMAQGLYNLAEKKRENEDREVELTELIKEAIRKYLSYE